MASQSAGWISPPRRARNCRPWRAAARSLRMGLSLAAGESAEEIFEARVTPIEPMVLDAVANKPTRGAAIAGPGLVEEGYMSR